MLAGSAECYPDDVFANVLIDNFNSANLDTTGLLKILSTTRREKRG